MTPQQEARLIRDELAYIGRYLDGISPKLAKAQELMAKKGVLRKRLKELNLPKEGTNPQPMKKEQKGFHHRDIIIPIAGEKTYNVDRLTYKH